MSQPIETHEHAVATPIPAHSQTISKPSGIQYAFGSTFAFNGVEVPFDGTDMETLQRFEEGIEGLKTDEAARPKDGKASVVALEFCKMYEHFIDHVLGEGTFLQMCGGKYSMAMSQQLYAAFLETMTGQAQSFQAIKAGIAKQYLPNRAARRKKK